MADQSQYPPIPNEQRILEEIRAQWHKMHGTALYRSGIYLNIIILNSRKEGRVEIKAGAVGHFEPAPTPQ